MPRAPPAGLPVKVTPKPPPPKAKRIGVPLGTRPTKGWTPYPSPLPQVVINTAVSVLRKRIHSLMGPDPKKRGGRVYYQAEYDPKSTKRRVTAWHKH